MNTKHTQTFISLSLILTLTTLAAPINAQRRRAPVRRASATRAPNVQSEAQKFIDRYTKEYLRLRYASSQAEWQSNTRIVAGDDTNAKRTNAASEALSSFT